jgi:hypothetical protein
MNNIGASAAHCTCGILSASRSLSVSAAQLLIVIVGLVTSFTTYVLLRFPEQRREQYRGRPFPQDASLTGAAVVLGLCLLFAWAQGRFEAE